MPNMKRSRFVLLIVAAAVFGVVFVPNSGSVIAAEPADLIFPVVGTNHYTDTFGACREIYCTRTHKGVDIMSPKMTPVVAADDGVVRFVNWSTNPADLNPERCCTLTIRHDDGWESWYLHLNNDTTGTDDGLGWGIADGIVPGTEVFAGQLIGWVGDSGNAENAGSHLHWEYHQPDGTVVNPTPYADGAQRITAPLGVVRYSLDFSGFEPIVPGSIGEIGIEATDGLAWSVDVTRRLGSTVFADSGIGTGTSEWDGGSNPPGPYEVTVDFGEHGSETKWIRLGDYEWPFVDDEGSWAGAEIEEMFERGFTEGCDWNLYCPGNTLTRAEIATMLARSMNGVDSYPSYQGHYADVPADEWYTGPIEYLVQEGVLSGGGGTFGVDYPATRALAVDMLMSVLGSPLDATYHGYFSDVPEEAWFRVKVETAHQMGIALGRPDGTFGPYDTLTREEAAAFLMRGL